MMKPYPARPRPIYEFFTFAGKTCRDFLLQLGDCSELDKRAERDVSALSIVGRNGDLTIDNGRYKNVPYSIQCYIGNGYEECLAALADHLTRAGYARWEDTFHPDEYTMAKHTGAIEPATVTHNSGWFDLTFERMPQRFLKSGEIPISFTSGASKTLRNPTAQTARPLITFTGGGGSARITFSHSGILRTLTISDASGAIVIDSELMRITADGANKMADVTFNNAAIADNYFPVFKSGLTSVTVSGASNIQIAPRWWKL